jgi:hypothetical protein
MIDVWVLEWFEFALGDFTVSHEDVVADFHEAAAVAVRMAMRAVLGVVLDEIKFIEHFGVRTAWVADRRMFRIAAT